MFSIRRIMQDYLLDQTIKDDINKVKNHPEKLTKEMIVNLGERYLANYACTSGHQNQKAAERLKDYKDEAVDEMKQVKVSDDFDHDTRSNLESSAKRWLFLADVYKDLKAGEFTGVNGVLARTINKGFFKQAFQKRADVTSVPVVGGTGQPVVAKRSATEMSRDLKQITIGAYNKMKPAKKSAVNMDDLSALQKRRFA